MDNETRTLSDVKLSLFDWYQNEFSQFVGEQHKMLEKLNALNDDEKKISSTDWFAMQAHKRKKSAINDEIKELRSRGSFLTEIHSILFQ